MKGLKKVFNYIDPRYKLYLFLTVCSILLIGFLEMAGISFIPILFESQNESNIFRLLNSFLIRINESWSIENANTNSLIILFCVIYIFKNIFVIFLKFTANILLMSTVSGIERSIYKSISRRNFESLSSMNKTKVIQLFSIEILNFRNQFLIPLNHFLSELFVASALIIFLFYTSESELLLIFSILILSISILIYLVSMVQGIFGRQRLKFQTELIKPVTEFLNGYSVIKHFNQGNRFHLKFREASKRIAFILAKAATMSGITINLMEIVILTMVPIVISFSIISGEVSIVSTGVYALVAYRLYPSLNRMTQSFAKLQFGLASVDFLANQIPDDSSLDYEEIYINYDDSLSKDSFIKIKNMSFAYNENKAIINNLNVEFPRKGIVSINGPNGVGKSTFLHLLIGFLKPTSGSIFWMKEKYKPRIAYVPQLPFIESTSLKDNIIFGRDLEESSGFNTNLKTLNFIDFYEEQKNELLGDGGLSLSGGQNQKINIARAIYSDFDVLVLDEPTSAQDALTSTQISAFLKKIAEDKLIIFISHEEDFSSLADYIFLMPDGSLIKNDKN